MEQEYWQSLERDVDERVLIENRGWNEFHVDGCYVANPGDLRQLKREAVARAHSDAIREDRVRTQLATLVAWDIAEHGLINAHDNKPSVVYGRCHAVARSVFCRALAEPERELLLALIEYHAHLAAAESERARYAITPSGRDALAAS